ncbi:MAG: hypothetical protein LBQ09_07375 [Acidobacteriaceae bacterium]|jgi:amidase|nr:hypothetical protein [Acidobacteriaceae bacterium]
MRVFLLTSVVAAWLVTPALVAQRRPLTVVEASIPEMQRALLEKRVTSVALVTESLTRIGLYDDQLHATLFVNRQALDDAAALDRERAAGHVRGPLHGIPVAVKDNVQTVNMPTTGGALAFAGYTPPYEATLVVNLRAAGAIVIAKTGMTELANWVAGAPTPMPTNYNSLGGFGFNPYDPRRDPRASRFDGRPVLATGGSSAGGGTAVSFWAANVGTETSGSILSPSNQNMLVGIKPTVGRISRYGVIPITADQDTPGPMARSVTDAAVMLGVLEGASPDPRDAATHACPRPAGHDYTPFLRADALRGARIGIPRAFYYDRAVIPGSPALRGGLSPALASMRAEVIDVLRQQGAIVVDPANIPSVIDPRPEENIERWNPCSGADEGKGQDEDCSIVLKYGMKRDFNRWLASLGTTPPVKTLSELRAWNIEHQSAGTLKYGQSNLDISDEMDLTADRARYERDRARDLHLSAEHGIDEVMKAERLDALLFPGGDGADLAARPGYPTVIVPFGFVPVDASAGAAFPAGFNPKPSPFGVSFTGAACSEPRLVALAYAFEQATKRRIQPSLFP